MTWYDIRWQGSDYVFDATSVQEKELTLLGIHGYATQAEARAHVQTMNELQAIAGGANVLAGTTALPAVDQPGTIAAGAGTVASAASKTWSLLGGFTTRNFWIRAAEFLLGIGLIITGLARLAPASGIATIAKAATL